MTTPGRLDDVELGQQPRRARGHVDATRRLVDALLAPGPGEAEVLHDVGAEDRLRLDAGLVQRPVEQPARGSDERLAGVVLLVPGLLAEHQQGSVLRAAADDAVLGVPVELAAAAGLHPGGEGAQRGVLRHPVRRAGPVLVRHGHRPPASWSTRATPGDRGRAPGVVPRGRRSTQANVPTAGPGAGLRPDRWRRVAQLPMADCSRSPVRCPTWILRGFARSATGTARLSTPLS